MWKFNFGKLSIRNRLVIQLVFLSVVTSINYSIVVYYDAKLSEAEKVVSVVGVNNAYSQQIPLYAILIHNGSEGYKKRLRAVIESHLQNLKLIRSGGFKDNFTISPASSDLIPTLDMVDRFWKKYQSNAEVLVDEPTFLDSLSIQTQDKQAFPTITTQKMKKINPKVEEALEFLLTNSQEMFDKNSDLTKAYLLYIDNAQTNAGITLTIVLVVNILLLIGGFSYINTFISEPISKISKINEIVSDGDFTKRIDYAKDDELGEVAKSINELFRNLKNATDFILAIGEGKLNIEYQLEALNASNRQSGTQDKLSVALVEMRDKMIEVAEQDRQRSWSAEGLAKFADILTRETDSEDFTYKIISNLVKYLDINQGAIFIVNDNNPKDIFLELIASYAFGKQKFVSRQIRKGEGLIGEVFQEGEKMYITEVPENFINITSGLGDANPKSVLIVPVRLNDQVYGALELASFQPFPNYRIEFVEKLGESIATTFATIKTNARTQRLLQDSMQLGEQMKAQEEEMRQNLEELVATQEEVQRKNDIIEQQKTELQRSLDEQILRNEMLMTNEGQLRQTIEAYEATQEELERQIQDLEQKKIASQKSFEEQLKDENRKRQDLEVLLAERDATLERALKK
jgi:HAMP domain-containing protein/GAF domain-containing protein